MTFPTKFTMLSFVHFMGRIVAMSWRTNVSPPPPGLALAATNSLLLLSSLVMTLPVSLVVTPLLIVPKYDISGHCAR